MKRLDGIAELEQAVGSHLGYSDWHVVDQDRIDLFAEATGDHQWIHVDAARAADGPFGATIAHGYLTLSLVSMLAAEVYQIEGVRTKINYGSNKVRFPMPVTVNSRIRAGVQLLSVQPSGAGVQSVISVVVEIEGSDKPACVAEIVTLLIA